MLEFRLLGPFEGPVPLPGGKPRALLARLLLDAGRIVPAPTLIEALWEKPPSSAPKVLQAHVSALRKVLGADVIETRSLGYALRRTTSDLARFEVLVDRARSEPDAGRRVALLREALGLWRGEPLVEFRREPFAQAAAMRLGELRLSAIGQRVDAELELGQHALVVPELATLVAEEPLREPLRRQLMLALYRSGRQSDALDAYREGRRLLVDRLGIEPGRELQALERAILQQDPALDQSADVAGRRGSIVCVGCAPLALVAPLGREIVAVELADDANSLAAASSRLRQLHAANPAVRAASFTTGDASADAIRLAREQSAELLVVADATPQLLAHAPCDVALLAEPAPFRADGPVVAPFGGDRAEWPALELAAWLARDHDLPLVLVGPDAGGGRRDASRTLAAASLALQRFAGITPQPALLPPGVDGLLGQRAAVIVASLPPAGLDAARRELLERARCPVLLVHGGLRPSGLAPDRTLTHFSWSAAPDERV